MAKPTTKSLKTRIGIGAAAVLAAGAMATVGIGVASASPSAPAPSATASPSAGAKKGTHGGDGNLGAFLRLDANSPQAAGDRAAKAAAKLVAHPEVFSNLPAALQADLTALKDAAPADRVKDAVKVKTTALSGGYGADIQKRAENLQQGADRQKAGTGTAGLRQELRTALTSANPGASMQKIADQLISHPKVFAKLPANLQSDLKALKDAAPADLDTQANKIKDTALNGGYGAKIQKAVQALGKKASAAAPAA